MSNLDWYGPQPHERDDDADPDCCLERPVTAQDRRDWFAGWQDGTRAGAHVREACWLTVPRPENKPTAYVVAYVEAFIRASPSY